MHIWSKSKQNAQSISLAWMCMCCEGTVVYQSQSTHKVILTALFADITTKLTREGIKLRIKQLEYCGMEKQTRHESMTYLEPRRCPSSPSLVNPKLIDLTIPWLLQHLESWKSSSHSLRLKKKNVREGSIFVMFRRILALEMSFVYTFNFTTIPNFEY